MNILRQVNIAIFFINPLPWALKNPRFWHSHCVKPHSGGGRKDGFPPQVM